MQETIDQFSVVNPAYFQQDNHGPILLVQTAENEDILWQPDPSIFVTDFTVSSFFGRASSKYFSMMWWTPKHCWGIM